jgi:repressor LexA
MGRTPAGQTRDKILRFVRDRLLSGRPPTIREVQESFGFRSPMTAREHLDGLVRAGLLSKEPGKARGYRLVRGEGPPTTLVPLLGRVPAGPLDTAIEDLEGYIAVQSSREPGELFGLTVKGESMTGAGILPGDVVIVRRQPSAEAGEIVVALVGEEATVKRLRVCRGRYELHAENPRFAAIVPDPSELKLLGKVIEVRRILGS